MEAQRSQTERSSVSFSSLHPPLSESWEKKQHKQNIIIICLFLFLVNCIRHHRNTLFKADGFISVPSTNPVHACSRCCWMMQPVEREAESAPQAEKGVKERMKEQERFSFHPLIIQWFEGKEVVRSKWDAQLFSFLFLPSFFLGFYLQTWTKSEQWRWKDGVVESTCSQTSVERWRGQLSCWWPRPPHGGSGAVAEGCCHSNDAELRSGGKSKNAEIRHLCPAFEFQRGIRGWTSSRLLDIQNMLCNFLINS